MDNEKYNPRVSSFTLDIDSSGNAIPKERPQAAETAPSQQTAKNTAQSAEKSPAPAAKKTATAVKKKTVPKVSINELVSMLDSSVEHDGTEDLIPLKTTHTGKPKSTVIKSTVKIIPPTKDDFAEARRKSGAPDAKPRIRVPILTEEDAPRIEKKPEPVKEPPKRRVIDPSSLERENDFLAGISLNIQKPAEGKGEQPPRPQGKSRTEAAKAASAERPVRRTSEPAEKPAAEKKSFIDRLAERHAEKAAEPKPQRPQRTRPVKKAPVSATEMIDDAATIVPQEEIPSATHQAVYGTLPENVYTERLTHREIANIIHDPEAFEEAQEGTEYDDIDSAEPSPVIGLSPEENSDDTSVPADTSGAEENLPEILRVSEAAAVLRSEKASPIHQATVENPENIKVLPSAQTAAKQNAEKAAPEKKEEPASLTKAEQYRLRKEEKYRKMSGSISRISGVILIAILVLVNVFNLISPDKETSENENRNLAQFPEFSWSAVLDGSFMSDLSSYVADQFFNRDGWISLRLKEDKALGATESNGVYLGKDGYLIEIPDDPDYDSVNKNLDAINQFALGNTDLLINMAIIPNNVTTMPDYLPDNAPARDQREDIKYLTDRLTSEVNFIDTTDILLAHQNDYCYYRTDHHWTSLGAYYAFMYMAGDLGITDTVSSYHIYTVTDSFEGTMASTSGCHDSDYLDSIEIYDPADTGYEFYVSYDDTYETSYSLYQSAKLEEKDKYTVFLGGNHPKVTIKSTNDNGKVLLLIKDSYANSFVQFLTPYYEEIIMIDPRYYYESVSSIITNESVTDVLFLYNMNTYLGDTSLADVLA